MKIRAGLAFASLTEIESYLDRRVKELTRGLQTPLVAKPGGMPDFPVAVW